MRSTPASTTLRDLQDAPGWVWAYCRGEGCRAYRAVAIAPFVIRWGPGASSDLLRERLVCGRCGHKGATLTMPSWVNTVIGWQAFPDETRNGPRTSGRKRHALSTGARGCS